MVRMYSYKKREADSPAAKKAEPSAPFAGGMSSLTEGASRKELPDVMRTKMENAFGADFSNLNIVESEKVAEGGAKAVTQGNTIAFAPGEFNVYSPSSEALLGHELSHVVSQARGESRGNGLLTDSYLEAKADREGVMAAAGQQVYSGPVTPLSTSSPLSVAGPMQCKRKKFTMDLGSNYEEDLANMKKWEDAKKSWSKDEKNERDKVDLLAENHLYDSVANGTVGSTYYDTVPNSDTERLNGRFRGIHQYGPDLFFSNDNIHHVVEPSKKDQKNHLSEYKRLTEEDYNNKKNNKDYKGRLKKSDDGYFEHYHQSRGLPENATDDRYHLTADDHKRLGHIIQYAKKIAEYGTGGIFSREKLYTIPTEKKKIVQANAFLYKALQSDEKLRDIPLNTSALDRYTDDNSNLGLDEPLRDFVKNYLKKKE